MNSRIIQNVQFELDDFTTEQRGQYTKLRMVGCELTDEIGAPELPVKSIKLALPYGAEITDIRILSTDFQRLPQKSPVSYVHKPVILSQRELKTSTEPNTTIYESDKPYPENIIEYKGTGVYDNQQICELLIHPVQYLPSSQELIFYNRIEFAVDYKGGVKRPAHSEYITKIVLNPEDVIKTDNGSYREYLEYLIISNPPLDTVFQRLADWKTKKGILTKIRTVDWIISHYSGEDNAARIRNYLKSLIDSNTTYVLLGGDTDIIPCRFAYAMSCSAGFWPGREDTMPCDLYYADLQETWDLDGDGSYGEIEDSIDLYPDLIVGRAPVNTVSEAQKFVEKVLLYEKNPDINYLTNAIFAADVLWSNPYTDQGIHKNKIDAESFPPYFNITKLYYSQGNLSPNSVKNALRQGQGLFNHDGHGWIDVMGAGTGYLHNIDFDTLTNAPMYGIAVSIGCWTTAFDFDAIAESFVNSPHGGGVAFIGNSSYGWGSPGNPGFGYSDRFDSRIFYSLLVEDNFHLGSALSQAKIHFIPYSREKNVYRWHQYQLNLLGDPEMCIWTDTPESLSVSYPQSIPIGNSRILISVRNKSSGAPVKNALVCLMKNNESYASGYTDTDGTIFLDAGAATSGNFDLTVTAHNYLPVEETIPVINGSYVNYLGWSLNDASGNNDGTANPGEEIYTDVAIKNTGNAVANNVSLILHSQDSMIVVQDSTQSAGSLNPGDSVYINNAFRVTVGWATNGYGIDFNLEITDASRTVNYHPVMLVGTPVFGFGEMSVAEPPTMPGDTESVYLQIENRGFGYAHTPIVTLNTSDPYITLLSDSLMPADIPPESSLTVGPFTVHVLSGCPPGHHPLLTFTIVSESCSYTADKTLIVGETGFSDDMESGTGQWTTSGTNNLWHLTMYRSFSPTHSWYCGDSITHHYTNNMDCFIQTTPFMLGENSILKFYRWFSVPLYGSDGIYVIIIGNGFRDTLDFIGTGGALSGRGIQSEWFEEKYSLADYPAGDTIQVRLSFVSDGDGDVGEGFYIDNFNVENITMIEEHTDTEPTPLLLMAVPNPFTRKIDIRFGNTQNNPITALRIYDVSGRLIKQFTVESLKDVQAVTWNGTDNTGKKMPAGIYFIQVMTENTTITRKAIMLR